MTEQNQSQFVPLGIHRTAEQIHIQTANCKVLMVEANAGAAKTTTLALRIGEALARNVAPESILVLVFTETARDVMRQRLIDMGMHTNSVSRITIATFDEFAAEQLSRVEEPGAYRVKTYSILRLQREPMLAALHNVYERYGSKYDDLQLDTHNVALTQFLEAQLKLKAKMAFSADLEWCDVEDMCYQFDVTQSQYLAAVEYERIRLGLSDQPLFRAPFDATYDLARDLESGVDRCVQFPDYRLVICDELHDLNEAAFRILSTLIDQPRCYFVGAGDKDQVIHATLGASAEFLEKRFKTRFAHTKTLPLTITFRHGPHLAYSVGKYKNKSIESHVPSQFDIKVHHYDGTLEAGAGGIIDAIKKWKKDGFAIDGCAILMRDRHQSIAIENALRQNQIAYRTPLMGSYLQREEILFLRGVMGIALSDFGAVKEKEVRTSIIEALALYGNLPIDRDTLEKAKSELAKETHLHWFYERYIRAKEVGQSMTPLDSTIRYAMSISMDTSAADVLREIYSRMDLVATAKRLYIRPYDVCVVEKSLNGFLSLAENAKQTVRQLWESINSAESFIQKKRDKDTVTLECVANSKGREFEHVIMPFMEINEFPSPMFKSDEEENLYYVGVTRARARLSLITPLDPAKRSPYIERMEIAGTATRANLAVQRNELRSKSQDPIRHYLNAHYADKDIVKSMGAKFDPVRKQWYVPSGIDLAPFKPWS